jgi:predicted transcriptional regulator
MSTGKDYAKLVDQANKAVSSVKDAELKRIAFQKILEDLMSGDGQVQREKQQPSTTKRTKPIKGGSKKASGTQAYIDELIEEGFFKKQKTISHVKAELENRGHHIPLTSMSGPMQRLCQRRILRRQKIKGDGKQKQTFGYSNW